METKINDYNSVKFWKQNPAISIEEILSISGCSIEDNIHNIFRSFKYKAGRKILANRLKTNNNKREIAKLETRMREVRDNPRGVLGENYYEWKNIVRDAAKNRLSIIDECRELVYANMRLKYLTTIVSVADEIYDLIDEELLGNIDKNVLLLGDYVDDSKHSKCAHYIEKIGIARLCSDILILLKFKKY